MIRVGHDLDGVHFLFAPSLWEALIKKGLVSKGTPMPPAEVWDFFKAKEWAGGLTPAQFVELCHWGVDEGIVFIHGGCIPEAREAFKMLHDMGFYQVIVTDRPFGKNNGEGSKNNTYKFLEENGYEYDEIHFTADKANVGLDYMIDDKPENFWDLTAAGVDCYLLDRPWNQHVDAGDKRVYSVREYAEIIIAKEGHKMTDGMALPKAVY